MKKTLTALAAIAVVTAVAAAPSSGSTTKTVSIKDDLFSPKILTISKGTAVRWVWKGQVPHNVAVTAGPVKFRAGTRTKGHFVHTFKKAGTYKLVCTIHAPDMKMTIKVK